jgi:hypothetical protein
MTKPTRLPHQPDSQQQIKTLSLPQIAFLLLENFGLPHQPANVADLLHEFAMERLDTPPLPTVDEFQRDNPHLHQYL